MQRQITEFPDIVIPDKAILNETPIPTHFETTYPLAVDVGCGKGRFLRARAAAYPHTHFFAIERQYSRVYRTAKKIHREGLTNVKIARVEAVHAIQTLLPNDSVTTFYIFFPDPWPKRRHHRRRLINPPFMDLVHRKLHAGGCLHFATDHQDYADVVKRVFDDDERFRTIPAFQPTPEEHTDFEQVFRGLDKPIRRLSVQTKLSP